MVRSDYLSAIFITTCGINNTESPFSLNNYHKNHFFTATESLLGRTQSLCLETANLPASHGW